MDEKQNRIANQLLNDIENTDTIRDKEAAIKVYVAFLDACLLSIQVYNASKD